MNMRCVCYVSEQNRDVRQLTDPWPTRMYVTQSAIMPRLLLQIESSRISDARYYARGVNLPETFPIGRYFPPPPSPFFTGHFTATTTNGVQTMTMNLKCGLQQTNIIIINKILSEI